MFLSDFTPEVIFRDFLTTHRSIEKIPIVKENLGLIPFVGARAEILVLEVEAEGRRA